jgi:hypothetical protein
VISWQRLEQAALRALLRRVDAGSLRKQELLTMIDLLMAALTLADSAPNLSEERLGR